MQTTYALSDSHMPGIDELVGLYDAVEWSTYTRDPAKLLRALQGSLRVVTARGDGQLVGLARVVGDGETIAYLQDILVHPRAQRTGLGRHLMSAAFEPFAHVRQKVLLTDDEPRQRDFYEATGFTEIKDLPHAVNCFVNFS